MKNATSLPLILTVVLVTFFVDASTIPNNVWRGTGKDWFDAANWSKGAVPGGNDKSNVLIPAGLTNYPSLNGDALVDGLLTIEEGASLVLNGHDIRHGAVDRHVIRGILNRGLIDSTKEGSVLQIGRGGFTNTGEIKGYPSLLFADITENAKISAGGAVLDSLTVNVHLWQNVLLGDSLNVRGDVRIESGVFSVGDFTLSIGGSLRIAPKESAPNIIFRMRGENSRIVFDSDKAAEIVCGIAADQSTWHHNVEFQNFIVNKPGSSLVVKGAPIVVNGKLEVADGRLEMADGGEVWLNVGRARNYEKISYYGAKIKTPVTQDILPQITLAEPIEPVPGVTSIYHNYCGPAIPDNVKLINVARFADITTAPYSTMARNYVDEDKALRTISRPENLGVGGQPVKTALYEFYFPVRIRVSQISWSLQTGPWALLADTNGNGDFDTLIRMDTKPHVVNAPGGSWTSRGWMHNTFSPAIEFHALQFVDLDGSAHIYDFQIMADSKGLPGEWLAPKSADSNLPKLALAEEMTVAPVSADRQILRGFHIEPWMLGIPEWSQQQNRPPLSENGTFQNFIKGAKEHGANIVNLWPPTTWQTRGPGVYEQDLLWPSSYDRHSVKENLLSTVAENVKNEGFKFFSMRRVHYPKTLEEFPPSATRDMPAPYIPRQRREYLKGIVREQIRSGVDGVGIGFDEEYEQMKNPAGATETDRKYFAERFPGVPLPEKVEDSLSYRKWMVFAYEQFADYLAEAAKAARSENPDVFTKCPAHITLGTLRNSRFGVGTAEDIIGAAADLDFTRAYAYFTWQSLGHYVIPFSVKMATGASQPGGVVSLHDCPWAPDPKQSPGFYDHFPPVYMRGAPISAIMNGARMALFWRYQNHFFHGGYNRYGAEAFSMLETMSTWGFKDASTPKNIAVLRSRASEDWWQLRQLHDLNGEPADNIRGYTCLKNVSEILLCGGYPFDILYLDQPGKLKNTIDDYDLLILPFAYSVPTQSLDILARAAANGKPIIAFDQLGSVDEWGEPRQNPALAAMADAGQIKFFSDDIARVGHHSDFRTRFTDAVDKALGNKKMFHFNPRGEDIEFSALHNASGDWLLSLINWTDREVEAELGLLLLPGGIDYTMLCRTPDSVSTCTLDNKATFSRKELEAFRVPLAPWDVKLFYIKKQ